METTFTLRDCPYVYIQLLVTTTQKPRPANYPGPQADEITVRKYLDSALRQYLGLTGTAVQIDILKIEESTIWIRLPSDDESAVVAALSQWTGNGGTTLRISGRASWLGALTSHADDPKFWSLET